MQDFLFITFFLGHRAGEKARALLEEYDLLEVARDSRLNRHAWVGDVHFGVHLRLPLQDERLSRLLERLRADGINVSTRLDREYSKEELDAADWLVMRTATAGLLGGVDFGQTYDFIESCSVCGAGAQPQAPLMVELGKMGKKDIDHLIYEQYFIISNRLAEAIRAAAFTGVELELVKSQRSPISKQYSWLRIINELPPMDHTTTGYVVEDPCPTCGRGGHFNSGVEAEVPVYRSFPLNAHDFNATWEYFGTWQQVRSPLQNQPVGGGRGTIVSGQVRRVFQQLRIPRMVWIPVQCIASPIE